MKSFSITDCGKERNMNQDYVFTSIQSVGNLPNLFVVADGMGGHNAGDFASKFTVDKLVNHIEASKESEPVTLIDSAIRKVNKELIEKAFSDVTLSGMGTTLVVATILDRVLLVANVGDSRLYIIDKNIRQITTDHSLVEEMIRLGELNKEEAKTYPDKNIITRAVGANLEIDVDFFKVKLEKDSLILMCTDGLTNMIEDKEIERILLGKKTIEEKTKELVNRANKSGGKDNITVVIIEQPLVGEVKAC